MATVRIKVVQLNVFLNYIAKNDFQFSQLNQGVPCPLNPPMATANPLIQPYKINSIKYLYVAVTLRNDK